MSEVDRLYVEFWEKALPRVREILPNVSFQNQLPRQPYRCVKTGISGVYFAMRVGVKEVVASVYITSKDPQKNEDIFRKLESQKEKHERKFGKRLSWILSSKKTKIGSIEISLNNCGINNRGEWERYIDFFRSNLKKFYDVFKPAIDEISGKTGAPVKIAPPTTTSPIAPKTVPPPKAPEEMVLEAEFADAMELPGEMQIEVARMPIEIDEERKYDESERFIRTSEVNKRSSEARQKCLDKHGYACKICGFDFEKTYGPLGKGFIEVHHIESVKTLAVTDPEKDLIPVCSNCHSMLHRQRPQLTPNEVKASMKK